MYLTITMQLKNNPDFLTQMSSSYVLALAEITKEYGQKGRPDKTNELLASLPAGSRRKVLNQAKNYYHTNKEIQTFLPQSCIWTSQDIRLDIIHRVIRLKDAYGDYREILFQVNHYQWLLLNYLQPFNFRIEKRDEYWYGWLVGKCTPEDYELVGHLLADRKKK